MKHYIHFKMAKLVRDGLPDIFLKLGHIAETRAVTGDELRSAMKEKIIEEASELPVSDVTDRDQLLAELGDVMQALQDTATACGFSMQDVESARSKKFAERGGFEGGLYVDTIAVPEDDEKWLAYYRAQPERFPELTDEP